MFANSARASKDPLLQPFQLKHLRLRNRILTTSHEPAYSEDGMPKDRYRRYHLARAKGGVAMVMTAGSASVSRDSPPAFGNLLAWKDEVVGWMRKLSDDVHEQGAAVMIQLTHLGYRTRWDKADWLPVLGAGPAREPAHRHMPKVIEDWDIARVIADFADASERMKAAGLDGVELEVYGHLLDQMISPLTNRLAAPWGGSFENRSRFASEVLAACRKRVGPDFLLGTRFVVDESQIGGTTADEGIALLRQWRDEGLIDFINVIRGRIHTDSALTDIIPVQGMASAPHLDFSGRVRAELALPTFHASRIPDVPTARHAIASGALDMVGMTRAHIADPDIIRKIAAGQEDDIRPCVGATYCLDRIYLGGMALCIHNASTGREAEQPHEIARASVKRTVVVVGAGPAGLEAARVAAERGHRVVVFEAADQPGGQIRLIARSRRRAEMIGIIDWRMAQCSRLGVDFRFNTWAEADDVLAENPDVVIIATGGLPQTEILSHGNELVVSTWDILSGDVKPGQNVLIFDDCGDHAGLQAAQALAEAGAEVEIMTADRSFAPEVMGMNLVPYMRALQKKPVTFTVTYRLKAVERQGNRLKALIDSDYIPLDPASPESFALDRCREVDQVVINAGTLPLDEIYFALKPHSENLGAVDYQALIEGRPQPEVKDQRMGSGSFRLYRIGDAVEARNIHAAIYDALRLLRHI